MWQFSFFFSLHKKSKNKRLALYGVHYHSIEFVMQTDADDSDVSEMLQRGENNTHSLKLDQIYFLKVFFFCYYFGRNVSKTVFFLLFAFCPQRLAPHEAHNGPASVHFTISLFLSVKYNALCNLLSFCNATHTESEIRYITRFIYFTVFQKSAESQ